MNSKPFIPFVSFLTVPYVLRVDRSDWEDVLIRMVVLS
jgi:hypothetical protein